MIRWQRVSFFPHSQPPPSHFFGLGAMIVDARGPEAIRSLMGLWGLRKAHAAAALNQACQSAMASGTRRLKDIKRLLASPGERQMTFQESHPLIRDLGVYGEFITNTHHANHTQIP